MIFNLILNFHLILTPAHPLTTSSSSSPSPSPSSSHSHTHTQSIHHIVSPFVVPLGLCIFNCEYLPCQSIDSLHRCIVTYYFLFSSLLFNPYHLSSPSSSSSSSSSSSPSTSTSISTSTKTFRHHMAVLPPFLISS